MEWDAETLLALSEQTGALVGVFDVEDRLRYCNAAFRAAFFVAEGEPVRWADIMRRNHLAGRGTRVEAPDFDLWLSSAACRRRKVGHRALQTDLHDGRWLLIDETVRPDGWMICVGMDVSGLGVSGRQALQDRDRALGVAQTDELTGISNRRHVMSLLDAMVEGRSASGPLPGSVCLLDVDHFKLINDRFGHPAGDKVLVELSRLVSASIRPSDGLGRVGGEEFMLVMPATTGPDAARGAERILAALRRSRPIDADPGYMVTASIGYAEFDVGDTARTLYARADKALYRAKRDGRDRVCAAA